ncbi:MAG: pseudouridine synthase [Bacteroidetes bacterium]|nr:MAG: pseudouridine synthase [Bacteroidota bacterium]
MPRLILFNKPYHVLCQFTDADGRATLADFVPVPGVYPAGRLDYDSEGLVVLTDAGWLQHRISDPQHKLPKTYWVQVERIPDDAALQRLAEGVVIRGRRTRPARVERMEAPAVWERDPPIRYRRHVPTAWLALHLREGRNRQVRRMTAAVGHPTLRLIRHAVGPWTLGDLRPGQWIEVPAPAHPDALARLMHARR